MSKLRVFIVDEESRVRHGIALLLREDPQIEVAGECGDSRLALEKIRALRPDLVFLGVQLHPRNGFALLEKLAANERPAIIFVTSGIEHAAQAFDVCAVDYLSKPVRAPRLRMAIERAKAWIGRTDYQRAQEQAKILIEHLQRFGPPREASPGPGASPAGRLVFKVEREYVFVDANEIAWIEAQGNSIRLHAGGRLLLSRESLQSVVRRLDPAFFIRIHRSFVVNTRCITKIVPSPSGDHLVLTNDGAKIRLSRTFRGTLKLLLAAR